MTEASQNSERALFTLPDGRVVECINEQDAEITWRELAEAHAYDAGLARLQAGDTVIDIGAHFGLASMHFADQVDDVRIIACEPAPPSFECLRANFERHLPHGTPLKTAVGAAPGSTSLTYYSGMTTMSTTNVDSNDERHNVDTILRNVGVADETAREDFWRNGRSSIEKFDVPVTTLGRILVDHSVADVGFLKIDVERAELDVLAGIDETAWAKIRSIAIEVHNLDDELEQVINLLQSKHYRTSASQGAAFAGTSVYIVVAER